MFECNRHMDEVEGIFYQQGHLNKEALSTTLQKGSTYPTSLLFTSIPPPITPQLNSTDFKWQASSYLITRHLT